MRAAIASAEVGDDLSGEDPTVNALQDEVAALFGHEAALFVPSGTMGNQLALRSLLRPGDELLCDTDAHIVTYEDGAAAALSGISTRTVTGSPPGTLDVDAMLAQVRPPGYSTVVTRTVAVENTHNRGGGSIIPLDDLRRLRAGTLDAGVTLHCDGARIWNAHVATGVPLHEYGALFDTLSVCLSKGLGAPVGSLLVSTRDRIAVARTHRHRLGGGMRQAGVLAAAGRYALAHHLERLADDHRRAATLAGALAGVGVTDPALVRTNLVLATVDDAPAAVEAAAKAGVLITAFGPRTVRMVTYLGVDDEDVGRAADVLTAVLSGNR
jgi:threonine aldolase